MKKRFLIAIAILATATAVSFAQKGPQGQNSSNHRCSRLNMADVRTISGVVTAVHINFGTQYPSLTVEQTVIKVAPLWFLIDNNFEIQTGDQVSVQAAPSLLPDDSYLYAIEISNITGDTEIVLRDADGVPLWTGARGGRGQAAAQAPANRCPSKTINTVTGIVEELNMGIGIQMPSLVVKSDTGTLISMKLGPESFLLAAGFELKQGERVTTKYLYVSCMDQNLALQLTNSSGDTLVLRNDDGTPAWN